MNIIINYEGNINYNYNVFLCVFIYIFIVLSVYIYIREGENIVCIDQNVENLDFLCSVSEMEQTLLKLLR